MAIWVWWSTYTRATGADELGPVSLVFCTEKNNKIWKTQKERKRTEMSVKD